MSKRVAFGFDHTVFPERDLIVEIIKSSCQVAEVRCMGPTSNSSCDYPDYAVQVCEAVEQGKVDCGILICGTGIGMSIAANKYQGIRAALCHDHVTATMCREHNNANVLCAGLRTSGIEVIRDIILTYLTTDFSNGERHINRLAKVKAIEGRQFNQSHV